MNINKKNIIVSLVLFAGLAGTMIAVRQSQETRRKAVEITGVTSTVISFDQSEVSLKKDESKEVILYIDTKNDNRKVTFLETQICYGNQIEIGSTDTDVLVDSNSEFDFLKRYVTNGCLNLAVNCGSDGGVNVADKIVVAKIKFKAKNYGETDLKFTEAKTYYTYDGSEDRGDIMTFSGAKFIVVEPTPTPTATNTPTPTLIPTNTPTSTPTPTNTPTPTPTATPTPACLNCKDIVSGYNAADRKDGDYNCDGKVDGLDYNIWREEYINSTKKEYYYRADHTCNKDTSSTVSLQGYTQWHDNYLK